MSHVVPVPDERPSLTSVADGDAAPIDWCALWNRDRAPDDWLIEPILPRGRGVAIWSKAKLGKSLLLLDIAAAAAAGRSVLGYPAREPLDIVYIDYEMTNDDVQDRLDALGYGPDDDLSHLHYYQHPSLPPLDTAAGGHALMGLVNRHNAAVVVIDTMTRAVTGEENSADPVRRFYRHTGTPLKAAGVALIRLDHAGHDAAGHARGTSAKQDDVDVIFQLVPNRGDRWRLLRTDTRIPWVPAAIDIRRLEEPLLSHVAVQDTWPAGTIEVAQLLDTLHVPLEAGCRAANGALQKAHEGKRSMVVAAAVRWRRHQAADSQRPASGAPLGDTHAVNDPKTMHVAPDAPKPLLTGTASWLARHGTPQARSAI